MLNYPNRALPLDNLLSVRAKLSARFPVRILNAAASSLALAFALWHDLEDNIGATGDADRRHAIEITVRFDLASCHQQFLPKQALLRRARLGQPDHE